MWIECDNRGCNARALVHVVLDTGYGLHFCGHHGDTQAEALTPYAAHTVDDRELQDV